MPTCRERTCFFLKTILVLFSFDRNDPLQNVVAKSMYSESLGKCCSLRPSLSVVSQCLVLEGDKQNGLFWVQNTVLLSLPPLISHRQFSLCLTHMHLDTGFQPTNKQGSIVPALLKFFGETRGSTEQCELRACHLLGIVEYCVFHRKCNFTKRELQTTTE